MWIGDVGLSDEQQLAVLGQGPEAVVDNELELVDLTTDDVEIGGYGVVVGDSLRVLVFYLVGNLAGCYQLLNLRLDGGGALGYLLDELEIAG